MDSQEVTEHRHTRHITFSLDEEGWVIFRPDLRDLLALTCFRHLERKRALSSVPACSTCHVVLGKLNSPLDV